MTTERWLFALRWVLPGLIFVTGIVVIGAGGGSDNAIEGGAMFMGAGIAVLLLNVLFRIGVEGDDSRDREEAARRYFDEHGHWPDQAPRG